MNHNSMFSNRFHFFTEMQTNAAGFQTSIEFKLQIELKLRSDNILQVICLNVLVQRVRFLFDFACLAVKVGLFLPSV